MRKQDQRRRSLLLLSSTISLNLTLAPARAFRWCRQDTRLVRRNDCRPCRRNRRYREPAKRNDLVPTRISEISRLNDCRTWRTQHRLPAAAAAVAEPEIVYSNPILERQVLVHRRRIVGIRKILSRSNRAGTNGCDLSLRKPHLQRDT